MARVVQGLHSFTCHPHLTHLSMNGVKHTCGDGGRVVKTCVYAHVIFREMFHYCKSFLNILNYLMLHTQCMKLKPVVSIDGYD